jgi:nucleoside-diphosphate-sugar epimerase
VTGATGFIGGRLVAELVKQGCRVRALARSAPGVVAEFATDSVEWVRGDILEAECLRKGMQDCEAVYHLAACARNWAPQRDLFYRQNVEGTRNVLAAAQAAGVRRLVCTSTIVTFGPTPPGVLGDESMPRTTSRFFTEYEESKTQAEQEVLAWAQRGLPVVIVNPTRVFGPGKLTEGNSVTLMIDQYDRGRLPVLLNRGLNQGNYVLVDDLVQGHLLAMERGRPGERYILGGENVSLKHFFALVDAASGRRHLQVNLPPAFALAFAHLERLKAEWLRLHPKITPGWVETFLADWTYSSAKAQKELGYRITPLAEGIRRTLEWLHERREKAL